MASLWKVTVHTLFRRPVFEDTDAARAVARMVPRQQIEPHAWVLLPDRWTAILEVPQGDCLDKMIQRFKLDTARVIDARLRINGWLWERGFDATMLPGASTMQEIRRLPLEAVRAGIADAIGAYPYWDSVAIRVKP